MHAPNQPVTLSPEQVSELSVRLSDLRHNVNNYLSLILAAADLIRFRPEQADRFVNSLDDPPQKITKEISDFSEFMEKVLHPTV